MILGSHDTMTYQTPNKFYLRPFAIFGKCQSLSWREQLNLGVRCFDFRIRFNKGVPYFCHGLLTYDGNLEEILSELNQHTDIFVRLGFENIFSSCNLLEYLTYCENLMRTYSNIKFQICKKKPQWTIIEDNFNKPFVEIQEYPDTFMEIIKTPTILAKQQSDKYHQYKNEDVIMSMDFIEITY